jgi:hypothetical protein
MRRRGLYAFLTFFFAAAAAAQTFTVVYGFPNVTTSTGSVDPGPAPSALGLVPGTFTAQGVDNNPSASGRFSFTGWPLGAVNGDNDPLNYSGALSPFSYYEVKLDVSPGYTLELQSISFDVRRSGTGIRNFSLRSDKDFFSDNLPVTTGTNNNLGVLPDNVVFWKYDEASTSSDQRGAVFQPGSGFSDITGPLYFRIYAWNAESTGGSFSIDNFSISGKLKNEVLGITYNGDKSELAVISKPGELLIRTGEPFNTLRICDLSGRVIISGSSIDTGNHTYSLQAGCYVLIAEKAGWHHFSRVIVY